MALYNLARVTTATVGIGPITLGPAVSGFLTFALSGVPNGTVVSYGIRDGANSEVGRGTYNALGPTLSRDTVLNSTNGGAKIILSGTAEVFITALKEDFHDTLTLGVPSGLSLVGQVLSLGLASSGVTGALSGARRLGESRVGSPTRMRFLS